MALCEFISHGAANRSQSCKYHIRPLAIRQGVGEIASAVARDLKSEAFGRYGKACLKAWKVEAYLGYQTCIGRTEMDEI